MNAAPIASVIAGCGLLLASGFGVSSEVDASADRLKTGVAEAAKSKVAVADDAEEAYCTADFKEVLQRVLNACGLADQGSRRGCQPADVKNLAAISDDDFNALFNPLKDRGAVIMFDDNSEKLDDKAKEVIEQLWKNRRGARYFFVVARASKTGTADYNQKLSQKRANSVTLHLDDVFADPEMDKKVGLLWLGNEFAQLGKEYCEWDVSRPDKCGVDAVNRSAFVSWVDCRL